jgi:hypothetical protein
MKVSAVQAVPVFQEAYFPADWAQPQPGRQAQRSAARCARQQQRLAREFRRARACAAPAPLSRRRRAAAGKDCGLARLFAKLKGRLNALPEGIALDEKVAQHILSSSGFLDQSAPA